MPKPREGEPVRLDLLADGWAQLVESPEGWEAFTVDLRADLVSGEPRITGVRVEPREGVRTSDVVLTVNRLRTLPLSGLAAAIYHATHLRPESVGEAVDALDAASEALHDAAPRSSRRATSAEEVARVYAAARLHGRPPRAEVCEVLSISSRTADRYISEARRRGVLPPYDERNEG